MNVFSGLVAILVACGTALLGTEWQALVGTSYSPYGEVIPIGIPSYTEGTPVSVLAEPISIAITPDGTKALVANYYQDNSSGNISVLDLTVSPMSVTEVPITEASNVMSVAITPDGKRALFGFISASSSTPSVGSLDLTTNPISVSTSAVLVPSAGSIAITPDGKEALVGSMPLDRGTSTPVMTVLDLTTTPISIVTNFVTGLFDGGIAITPDGTKALAVTTETSTVTVLDLTAKPYPVQLRTIGVGISPLDVAITPDGKKALVTCRGGGLLPTPGITVLDLTKTPICVQTLLVSTTYTPSFLAITPDSSKAVVSTGGVGLVSGLEGLPANGGGMVAVFDLTTVPISQIETPSFYIYAPLAVAITPDEAPTARFKMKRHGKKVTFNAGSSSSPVGTIQKYHWNFGDGHKKTTDSSFVKHTYRSLYRKHSRKPMVAKLTVTNTAGTSTHITFTGRTVSNHGGSSAVCKHHVVRHSRGIRLQAVKRSPLSLPALLTAAQ